VIAPGCCYCRCGQFYLAFAVALEDRKVLTHTIDEFIAYKGYGIYKSLEVHGV
jgi:hypothetical protein